MALAAPDREILVIERDAAPPADLEATFESWDRKGVTQLRHSHVFLGRLFSLIRDRHPRLLQMLLASGVRELDFEVGLPAPLRGSYKKVPGDENLSILFSRRTTLEHVMRDYVRSLPGVKFISETLVRGLLIEHGEPLRVAGLVIERESGAREDLSTDIVVDASGRNTLCTDWLRENGCVIDEEESPAGILYFTRHYRLRDHQDEPPRDGTPGAGDLGYIKFGVFPADNRHFSITLAVPEIEFALRTSIVRPETFDAICAKIPGCARWTNPARAEPVTKVFAMGNLKNIWKRWVRDGEPEVLGFFAVGDAALRTNPLYGRGCSSAVMHAHILADVLAATSDPTARAMEFEKRTWRELHPFWEALRKQDLSAIRRAKNEQNPNYKPRLKARLIKSFADDAITPASRGDIKVFRALMPAFHMLEKPGRFLLRPGIMARVFWVWAQPKSRKAHLYPPKLGPDRGEMLRQLGLKGAPA
ncbi:MAG: FAD-dependent oxidoreductase [Alphaproteobacteria bacterium]|nr:FAD-dependent oxidoreductase [Alphaproteobacteria bacterium]